MVAATTMVTVAALNNEDGITMDKEAVVEAATRDPIYQLLLVRVLADDWHLEKAQELACLCPYYRSVRDRLAVTQAGHVHL